MRQLPNAWSTQLIWCWTIVKGDFHSCIHTLTCTCYAPTELSATDFASLESELPILRNAIWLNDVKERTKEKFPPFQMYHRWIIWCLRDACWGECDVRDVRLSDVGTSCQALSFCHRHTTIPCLNFEREACFISAGAITKLHHVAWPGDCKVMFLKEGHISSWNQQQYVFLPATGPLIVL